MRPIIKCAGGKSSLLPHIEKLLPRANRLVEPFAGGAAVTLNMTYPSYWVNDINTDMTAVYSCLQLMGKEFIESCRELFTLENNTQEAYLNLRQQFNDADPDDSSLRGKLFLYLNRHCFNGLTRYNKDGIYNTPFGKYRTVRFPEEEMIYFGRLSRDALVTSKDFRKVFETLMPGDVVYCDPPYVPLSKTANFTSYSAGGFSMQDQQDLTRCAEEAKVPVLLSNHDTPAVRALYKNATRIKPIKARRAISCKGASRIPTKELMALYMPS